jgi:hypothetical protein
VKILGRDPALYLALAAGLLSFAATLGFRLLTPDHAGLWIVAINAVAAAATAATVRPIGPAAFTYALGAVIALIGGYGFELSAEQVTGLNGLVIPILSMWTRTQVSPIETAVSKASREPTPEAAKHEALEADAADGDPL